MSYLRIISISTVLLFQPLTSYAKNVDEDLQRCASAALQERGQSASRISVNTGGLQKQDLDRDSSISTSEYHMTITNKVTSLELGTVICKVHRSGKVLAAAFDV
ncbi:MAG: hypothetical protein ACI9FR_003224 [Cryomorphaceae bacterium]|jgi:hypothetical protein